MIALLNLTFVDTDPYSRSSHSEIYYAEARTWADLLYYEFTTIKESNDCDGYLTAKFKLNQYDKWLTFDKFYKMYSKKIESPKFKHLGMEIVNEDYEIEFHNTNTDL